MHVRIEGTGPVALATALWMVRAGIPAQQIALPLNRQATSILPADAPRRALALSEGSRQLLARLIPLPPAGQIDTVEIFQGGRSGHTTIRQTDFPLPALGWVVVWEELIGRLHEAAERHAFASPDDPAFAHPDLRVHAGGMPPPDQRDASAFDVRDSGQAGLLFEVQVNGTQRTAFECFRPNGPLALLPAPALAPGALAGSTAVDSAAAAAGVAPSAASMHAAPGTPAAGSAAGAPATRTAGTRYTVVWSDAAPESRRRAALSTDALTLELREALRQTLGARHWHRHREHFGSLQVVTPAVAVPLPRTSRRNIVAPGEVWIGNAAQALHPVAGQGLNLGLRDAFTLAQCLSDAWASLQAGTQAPTSSGSTTAHVPDTDTGETTCGATMPDAAVQGPNTQGPAVPGPAVDRALQAYAQARRRDRTLTIQGTDLLAHSFGWPIASRVQSALLGAMHVAPALRMPLARALVFGHRQPLQARRAGSPG